MSVDEIERTVSAATKARQRIRMTSATGNVFEGRAIGVLRSGSLGVERAHDDFYGTARATHPAGPVPEKWRIVSVEVLT
jgi:hypothetical protein